MPVIKSAIKKLRHDKVKEKDNNLFRNSVEKKIKAAQKTRSPKAISEAFSIVDKAVKKHLIHKNKAARIKSKLSQPAVKKTVAPVVTAKKEVKAVTKAPKNAPAKTPGKTPSKKVKKASSKK